MKYPEIPHLKNNPCLEGFYSLRQNVTYSTETGEELKMTLILPWSAGQKEMGAKPLPLIVFVQGSAWTTPDFDYELPQLAMFAHDGYVVATVGHRDCTKGHPFPAYLQDVKCAVRYLRKHADEYGIDPERVVIWGTSSGGNTAQLVGLTADEPGYETGEYAGYSDSVCGVVSCFGPTDMVECAESLLSDPEAVKLGQALLGTDEDGKWQPAAREMSPYYHVEEGKSYPPFLLLNGNADTVVECGQMVKMYHRLLDCGADVQAYQVDGGVHENNFWSGRVLEIIREFIRKVTR